MIYGVGIDLVMTSRIEEALRRWGERFREKVFTAGEIQYCLHKRNPAPSFSARFAAKEAFSKALGVGMRWGVHWKDVEVKRGPLGKPVLQLHGRAKELCRSENIQGIFLSLTHDRTFSSAMVVLERNSQ